MDFRDFIKGIISKTTSNQDFLDRLTDDEAMGLYRMAFIHKSVDPVNNYEKLEFKGDTILNCVSVVYLMERFPQITEEGLLTSMKHFVTEKKFFDKMAKKLGFPAYIQIIDIPEVRAQTKSINEDVYEAFNGAFFTMCEEKIFPGSGYQFVKNLVAWLLEDEEIPNTKTTLQKPRALLKEIWDSSKLPKPHGGDIILTSHESRIIDGKDRNISSAWVNFAGRRIGFAESFNLNDAKDQAAAQAIKALERQGITVESSKAALIKDKRRVVDPLLAQFQRRNPNLKFAINTIKKSDKNSDAIVGFYIMDNHGRYNLKQMARGPSPEAAEEQILRQLLR